MSEVKHFIISQTPLLPKRTFISSFMLIFICIFFRMVVKSLLKTIKSGVGVACRQTDVLEGQGKRRQQNLHDK